MPLEVVRRDWKHLFGPGPHFGGMNGNGVGGR